MTAAVFISYARSASATQVRALRDALIGRGVEAFFDETDIPPGSPYPARLADALCAARLVVVFAHQTYFSRPWCVYEFRVATSPYRADAGNALQHLVIALPDADPQAVVDHLPPPVAEASWPVAASTGELVALIERRLGEIHRPLGEILDAVDDDAVRALRTGALVPTAAAAHPGRTVRGRMPASILERFVGRTDVLWRILDALDSRGAEFSPRSCAIQGGGGMGKSQLAAEFVARYAVRHYPDGYVWINAEGGDEDLAGQLHAVLSAFSSDALPVASFGERASDRVEAISAAVSKAIPRNARLLWVVDNVPEPAPPHPPQPLARWCPVRHQVTLLCTTRRAGIEDVDAHVQLRELPLDAAVELLTQSPVKSSWLKKEGWRAVAQWLGCWPLGLRIAQSSLGDGFLRADELLAKARGDEPATALEAEVEALRGEVAADYLRGVAEVFRASYDGLATKPQARFAAHLLSRLARIAIGEELLGNLVPGAALGILAKRSWIIAGEHPDAFSRRTWEMHAVVASYLRYLSDDPQTRAPDIGPKRELAVLAGWLRELFLRTGQLPYLQVKRHFRVIAKAAVDVLAREADAALLNAAGDLAISLATWRLDDFELREIRFYAAGLADSLGLDGELCRLLRAAVARNGEDTVRSCIAAADGMGGSEAAARFLLEHLDDPRDRVRWQVYPSATKMRRTDIIAPKLLEAMMRETAESVLASAAVEFETSLADQAVLPQLLDSVARFLAGAVPRQRRLAAGILGRTLRVHGRQLSAGDWTSRRISEVLLDAALNDPDGPAAEACARALSWTDEPEVYESLSTAVRCLEPRGKWRRSVDVLVRCVIARERPVSPEAYWTDDDGESAIVYHWPKSGGRAPQLLAPVAEFVTSGDGEAREFAIAALCGRVFGSLVAVEREAYLVAGGPDCHLMHSVLGGDPANTGREALLAVANACLDSRQFETTAAIAQVAMSVDPEFSSAYWWRGQAREALGDDEGAMADFGRVAEILPAFADAWYRRGELRLNRRDTDGALADYDSTIRYEPNHTGARFRRAWIRFRRDDEAGALVDIDVAIAHSPPYGPNHEIRAGCLAGLGRFEESVEAATRAIELDPKMPDTWYYRAVARVNLGRYRDARADLQLAIDLRPDDSRFRSLDVQLKTLSQP